MKQKTEWDFSEIIQTEPEEKEEQEKIKKETDLFIKKYKENKEYLTNPGALKQALEDSEKLDKLGTSGNQGYFYYLKSFLNQLSPEIKAKNVKINEFSTNISNNLEFFMLNLAKISKEKQKEFLGSKELEKYRHLLEKLFRNSKYLLSEPEEKILNLKSQTSHEKWVNMTRALISKEERKVFTGKKEEIKNFSEISNLLENKNKKIRDSAAKAFNEILIKNIDIAEEEINAVLLNKKINDELRGFKFPEEARHIADDIKTDTVNTLIKAVTKKFYIANKYYKLKSQLLGLKKLQYHERNVPYGNIEEKYDYEKSLDIVFKVLNNLDNEFGEVIKKISDGKIDVFPKKGKMHGAFCFHNLKSQPTYVLLNHTDRLQDVLTLAHELGHGINNELTRKMQPSFYFGTLTSTAEVASTFMEDFVLQELLKNSDDEEKLSIIITKIGDDINTILRQVACYNFEKQLHIEFRKKGYLSKEEIGKIFQENMKSYMGEFVEQTKENENWWVHWPHIREFFYVYSYSSGLLISKAMQNMVKQDSKSIEKIKQFLSSGTSKSPEELFSEMGIELNEDFWDKGLSEIENLLKEAETLAKKLGKI